MLWVMGSQATGALFSAVAAAQRSLPLTKLLSTLTREQPLAVEQSEAWPQQKHGVQPNSLSTARLKKPGRHLRIRIVGRREIYQLRNVFFFSYQILMVSILQWDSKRVIRLRSATSRLIFFFLVAYFKLWIQEVLRIILQLTSRNFNFILVKKIAILVSTKSNMALY